MRLLLARHGESVWNAEPPGCPDAVPLSAGPPLGVSVTLRLSELPVSECRWVTLTVADLRTDPTGIGDGGG